MAKDNDIEGIIDSIRGTDPSPRQVDAIFEEQDPTPDYGAQTYIPPDEVISGMVLPTIDEIVAAQPMTAPGNLLFHTQYQNSSDLSINGGGDSLTISSNGTIRLHTEGLADRTFNLSSQNEAITTLSNRVAQLENIVRLLGQALNAQIDNEMMSQLAPEERQELRRVVAERDANQQHREEIRQLMRQASLPLMRPLR